MFRKGLFGLDNKVIILLSLFFFSMIFKLIFRVDYLEDYDAIDFAFALKEFDLSAYKPHFPGYPVYIFFGRVINYFISDETLSLTIVNIIFGSLCPVVVYLIALTLFDKATALLSAAMIIANPSIAILSNSVNSDVPALFFLLLFLYFIILSDRHTEKRIPCMFLAGLFFGVTLGVRVSYVPFIVLWIVFSKLFKLFKLKDYEGLHADDNTFILASVGLVLGVALWALPLLYVVGVKDYYYEGIKFVNGHFNDWGGTYVTDPSLVMRVKKFVWQLFAKGLGVYSFDTSFVRLVPSAIYIIALFSWVKRRKLEVGSFNAKIFLLYVLPYLIWIFFAQNLEKVRHVLPVIPIFIIYISAAIINISNKKYRNVVIAALLTLIFIDTSVLLNEHKTTPPPPYQVMQYVRGVDIDGESILYCGEASRFFEYYYPNYFFKRVKTAKEVIEDLDGMITEPKNIYIVSTVSGVEELDVNKEISFKRSRYIYNPFNSVSLYKLNRESINLLEF
ncbi:glycosyltransferase family 39 protein [Thermodesulfobacteriota bacterium]